MPALVVLLRYWRELLAGCLAAILVLGWFYLQELTGERDRLRQDKAVLTVQLQGAVEIQELTNRMTEAIGQIKIRSNVNVTRIEREPAPKFVDARPLPFIAGGVQPLGLYSSAAAGGADAGHAPSGSLSAGESAGGILPH